MIVKTSCRSWPFAWLAIKAKREQYCGCIFAQQTSYVCSWDDNNHYRLYLQTETGSISVSLASGLELQQTKAMDINGSDPYCIVKQTHDLR